ncbi:MAG: alpha/beta fold hydrolase [Candidatus Eremiobacteraeota bacterium]|nr:alpha/beta fold hydrolase [Candidatus Eremiobacteraeota bacterium]
MKRRAFLRAALSTLAIPALGAAPSGPESEISLKISTGTLFGTLTLPSAMPAPLVLIVAGSGPTDRNGNNPLAQGKNDAYALLASALSGRGIASVRYDKRGIGASWATGISEKDLRFENYAEDAASWIRLLAGDGRFKGVTLAGHSEGSLLGMIAVQNAPARAFVSLEGAGRPAPVVLREQLQRNLSAKLYAKADAIIRSLQQGKLSPNPPPELVFFFRESVQPYLISWFKYDPATEIAKVRLPVTIVQGTADLQVSMDDERALAHGNPEARVVVVDGMNHVLKHAPNTWSQQGIIEGYEDPSLPVDDQVVEAVASAA